MPLWEPGLPDNPELVHRYDMWDAAYVLGSLSPADRREFELHLADCARCRESIAELSGIPALLARLDHDVLLSLDEVGGTADTQPTQEPPAELLPSLLAKVRWRRRRSRFAWVASAAAAAVLAIGVFVGVTGPGPLGAPPQVSAPPQASAAALPMARVHTALLASTVSLSNESWGTLIALHCVCLAPSNAPHDTLAMVVVGRDGSHSRLASWVAHPGHTAMPTGSTSMPADQIASVQVVSADSGQVLLQRTL
ncbi:MAG TPA: zf-HC2 domain-containing protein [Mycobacterium sp.]|nr:zf-HC2 domain-containing protein [Mycobacterium sp.]